MPTRWAVVPLLLAVAGSQRPAAAFDVVLNAQGEFLDAYPVKGRAVPPRLVFIDPDPADPATLTTPPRGGRHVNGKLCFLPSAFRRRRALFVIADDTYREACLDRDPPQARCAVSDPTSPLFVGMDPDGWAVFDRRGRWTGDHIHTPWNFSEPQPQGNKDPQGCVFDARGRLFATDVGSEHPGLNDGSLIVFFPGRDRRYTTFCFLDKALADPGMPAMDRAGALYVPEPQAGKVTKFAPPFPASAAECDNPDRLVTVPPTKSVFLQGGGPAGLSIPVSIVRVPHTHDWYVAGILAPAIINEYDASGVFVRNIVPPDVPRNPIGMDVGRHGTLYYAELNLDPVTLDTRCGSLSMVTFDAHGTPRPPQRIGRTLRFPDGVTVVDSSRFAVDFTRLPPARDLDPSACGGE